MTDAILLKYCHHGRFKLSFAIQPSTIECGIRNEILFKALCVGIWYRHVVKAACRKSANKQLY